MSFGAISSPGRSFLAIVLVACLTTPAALLTRSHGRADYVVWTFVEAHRRSFSGSSDHSDSPVQRFQHRTGQSVDVQLINARALDVRLMSLLMNRRSAHLLPDLVEIEIGSVGKFLRPPGDVVGLRPLNEELQRSGWWDRIVRARLLLWSRDGVVYGAPHDVHPVAIVYRRDLFEQVGLDPASVQTWDEFRGLLHAFRTRWREHGENRFGLGLPANTPDHLSLMLLQRGINLLDEQSNPQFDHPLLAPTVAYYASLLAGPDPVASRFSPGPGRFAMDLARGDIAAVFAPDWRVAELKQYAPSLAGKLALMPLPRWDVNGPRTSSWGGTCMMIPSAAPRAASAFELLETLYYSPEALRARMLHSGVIPPVMTAWADPRFDQPDPWFAGQKVLRLYCELAREVPEVVVTSYSALAQMELAGVLQKSVAAMDAGVDSESLSLQIREWCDEAESRLDRRIAFMRFPGRSP
jgi:arabinosaccharide transport system substrate-binding protein